MVLENEIIQVNRQRQRLYFRLKLYTFSFEVVYRLFAFVVATWLVAFFLCSGDVHPNSGPSLVSSSENLSSTGTNLSPSVPNSLTTCHNLSFIHYNVHVHNHLEQTRYTASQTVRI